MTTKLWELEQKGPRRFSVQAEMAGCVGPPDHQMFMGGVATAAAIDAMQRTSGRPAAWASTQFLGRAMHGDGIDIVVEHLTEGRTITHAVAELSTSRGLISTVRAALGTGDATDMLRRFVAGPDVAAPLDCPSQNPGPWAAPGNLLDLCERRTASAAPDAGSEDVWIRLRNSPTPHRATLAVIAEFLPGAHPDTRGGSGLDLTLRFFGSPHDDWTLLSTRMQHFGDGLYHATADMFTTDGDHIASAAQTGRLPPTAIPTEKVDR